MFLKQIRAYTVRVPDPMRPGRTAPVEKTADAHAVSISHGGKTYSANDAGYFDVPADVGAALLSLRYPDGGRYATPAELGEDPEPVDRPHRGRPRKTADDE